MTAGSSFNAGDNERRFDDALPWYVNGTIDADEKAWVDTCVAASPVLASKLQDERVLAATVRSVRLAGATKVLAEDDDEEDLKLLMARVRANSEQSASLPTSSRPLRGRERRGWPARPVWLARPSLGMAMAGIMIAQTAALVWMATRPPEIVGAAHSDAVTEMRTLRVAFKPEATETQIRTLLVGASVHIVGGPTQMGEYWVASATRSLQEVKASLLQSGLVASTEVDTIGPQGQ